jgi:glycosidase
MQWDDSKYAGFSTAKPWQKEIDSYKEINAASQVGVPGSVFEYWASILKLRKSHKDLFIYGNFEMMDKEHSDVFAYLRTYLDERVLVVANMRKTPLTWSVPRNLSLKDEPLISNYEGIKERDGSVELRPFEAFVTYLR